MTSTRALRLRRLRCDAIHSGRRWKTYIYCTFVHVVRGERAQQQARALTSKSHSTRIRARADNSKRKKEEQQQQQTTQTKKRTERFDRRVPTVRFPVQ